MKKFAFLFTFLLLPLMVCADAVEIDGINYNLNSETLQAEVTRGAYSGAVVIPNTVTMTSDDKTYDVTSIGNYTFSGCTGLTTLN